MGFHRNLIISLFTLTLVAIISNHSVTALPDPDPNGYLVFCPCMGRFGNQADQYLGALRFAKALNRTLILPPWVEYRRGQPRATMVAWGTYFQVDPLREFHRVIPMEDFMATLADVVWPVGDRKVFCYVARHGSDSGCNAKDGNPFGPFWDHHNIDFVESVIYKPLFHDASNSKDMRGWGERYPPAEFPVIAFTGAPGSFPVKTSDEKLQKYIKWNKQYTDKAGKIISDNVPDGNFVGIHLRNGPDFEKACEHIENSPLMFSAKQCVGDRMQWGETTMEMCKPKKSKVVAQLKKAVEKTGASAVFVATDNDDLRKEITAAMPDINYFKAPHEPTADPMLDLCIMSQADHFIGNCVSSFTAFVKRSRDVEGLPSEFWAFKRKDKSQKKVKKDSKSKQEL